MTQGRLDRQKWFSPIKEFTGVTPSFLQEALNELVNDSNSIFYISSPGFAGSYPVGSLPTGYPKGSWAYAINGCKVGEASGSGTGCPVYFDVGNVWRTFTSDDPPTA